MGTLSDVSSFHGPSWLSAVDRPHMGIKAIMKGF